MARKRSSYYDDYWYRYEPPTLPPADGIRAKSRRGKFVQSWWASRWIEALTPLMDAGRLSRGRSYARGGRVLEIAISSGEITARVQGSRPRPYRITIELKPLSDRQWTAVFDAMAEQALYAAQLLNGEMPDDIEQIFDAVKVPLFPTASNDLDSDCSCPDWANPCKHIAAVYYLLGERFDEDPFLLFTLRGRDKEAVAAELRKRRASALPEPPAYVPDTVERVEALPLTDCLEHYWGSSGALNAFTVHIAAPPVDLALLKRVGLPTFTDSVHFRTQMERVYTGVTEQALATAFADREGD